MPWSGKLGELGQDMYYGAKACFDEVNAAGGIKGAQLELAMLDDSSYVHWAKANAGKLVNNYGAIAVMGCVSAPVAKAAFDAVQPAGAPVWGPFTGADVGVRFRASVQREVGELMKANGQGATQIVLVHYDDEFGRADAQQARAAIAAAAPASKVSAVGVNRNFPLVPAHLQAITAARPQAAVLMVNAEHCLQATDALVASGAIVGKTLRLMATSEAGGNMLLKMLGGKGEGAAVAVSVPYYADGKRAIVRRYQAAMSRVKEGRASFASFESYVYAAALVEALKQAKEPSAAALAAVTQKTSRISLGDFAVTTDASQAFVDLAVISAGRFRA